MALSFRQVYLPYCLIPLQDDRFIVVNRKYKPLGEVGAWVEYETHPSTRHLDGLTAAQIARISVTGQADAEGRIYLYRDGHIPTANDTAWQAYQQRLQALAEITVQ